MSEVFISIDGTLKRLSEAAIDPNVILGYNWVYATINTLGHKPLHLTSKLRQALDSYEALYSHRPSLTAKEIASEIYSLLHFGFYPEGGNIVRLHLAPNGTGGLRRIITHLATTPYEGYGLLAVRPRATIANYEIPFERHQTSISLSASRFASEYAQRTHGATALRASRAGLLLSADDSPLVVVRGFNILTAPIAEGGRDSVERELLFRLADMAGVTIQEQAPMVEDIESYDEILVFKPTGIESIYSVGEHQLENIYAHLLSKHLRALSREGLAR